MNLNNQDNTLVAIANNKIEDFYAQEKKRSKKDANINVNIITTAAKKIDPLRY